MRPSGRVLRKTISEYERVGTVKDGLGCGLEVLFLGIKNSEVERRLQKLQQRIALDDEVNGAVCGVFVANLLQRFAQQGHAFGKIALLGTKPERTMRSCGKKAGTVCYGCLVILQVELSVVIVVRENTEFSVLSADAVAKLSDLSRDELCLMQCGDDIADQLRFADAASVSANHD